MLTIWDTAGQEEYEALQDGYIREADGFIIVYSITDRKSFDQVTLFFKKILRVKDSTKEPMVILANKADLEEQREVTTAEGLKLAQSLGCQFFEGSAKTKHNVVETYHTLLRMLRLKERDRAPSK
eukprot:TRINITY_DN1493_c0_g1_i1.p1 TRINITY_DN1493_c0_g1~~TRINITY_DN1493_c0_g1_i1.p1  ORF type:complete len:125 (+),score=27.33 TRINITY_DN1493_c0_g1_i1:338-712(+)